jgi:catechol 2,3-dioxygenase-like lactoylglutathione lyase family enzyme
MFGKIDHIGHVVNNFEDTLDLYQNKFGLKPRQIVNFAEFGSKMAFFPFGDIEIEVIQPGGKGHDPAFKCLKERGEGVFHISIRVDDYDKEIERWRKAGLTFEEYTQTIPGYLIKLGLLTPKDTKGLWIEITKKEAI